MEQVFCDTCSFANYVTLSILFLEGAVLVFIEFIRKFMEINTIELLAYLLLLVYAEFYMYKQAGYCFKCLQQCGFVFINMCIIVCISILFIVITVKDTDTECVSEDNSYTKNTINYTLIENSNAELEEITCFTNTKDYYSSLNGIVCCTIYTTDNKELTSDMLFSDTEFCESVEILRDAATDGKYTIIYCQFTELGTHTVKIQGTDCMYRIHITEDLSDRVAMTCTPSSTVITNGENITLLLNYTGVDTTTGTATLQYDDTYILLHNCVGNIESVIQNKTTVCVTLTNVGILDKTKNVSVEVLQGTMIDSVGASVNGAVVELTQVEV